MSLIKSPPLLTGPWTLSDLNAGKIGAPKNGLKVFSCFACGGGSTMGYKLAGYDVLGYCEIDKEMSEIYDVNHNPKLKYKMPIQEFKNIPKEKLHPDLFNLDILDGSPPCSSFSMAGAREKKWGKKTHFREGQAEQILDDLFFDFIDVAERLQPKIVIAENVKGLILGNAKGYAKEIFNRFKKAGYDTQLFLLNAAAMGVPQKRERTFFIAKKTNKKIVLSFNEKKISLEEALKSCKNNGVSLPPSLYSDWVRIKAGKKKKYFSSSIPDKKEPSPTITTTATGGGAGVMHYLEPRKFSDHEIIRISSFPEDFNFLSLNVGYVCGMSVPPFMMQRVAIEIHKQFFKIS